LRHFTEAEWPPSAGVRDLVGPGDLVVDVGANIGYVTMLLSRWVGESGRVYSMEPTPVTFELLAHNVSRLNLANVALFPYALSSREGSAWMEVPRDSAGMDNLYESHLADAGDASPGGDRQCAVHTRRLDSLLHGRSLPVGFMKIDVEGHELQVLQGAEDVLSTDRPALLIEIGGNPDEAGGHAAEVFRFLAARGYLPYLFEGGRWCSRGEGQTRVDYFFLHREKLTRLGERRQVR